MHPVVIGTAGHIDHGKTALVRRLTGIDTDRLKEERERGISIDLGFAHLALPSGRGVAIIDVPGHERFVKNMLAGATGIDVVILVVAADEGVMPQTREHFAIVELLDVRRGVVALTKSDLVSPELLAAAREEITSLLQKTPLAGAPIVPVSSVTGAGVPELLSALDRAVASLPERDASGPPRLPVDRVFSIDGIGTVVTGTLWSGSIRAGDALELLPSGVPVRVRQVEVHDQPTPEAVAGQRTAVALHGVSRQDVARGAWLVAPDRFRAGQVLDVRLRHLPSADRELEDRVRVRVHLGASEALARVVLLEGGPLAPGGAALTQLRLEEPVVAIPGDRLVIRAYSPSATIAGAVVLDTHAERRARIDPKTRRRLETFERGSLHDSVVLLIEEAGNRGIHAGEIALRLAVRPAAAEEAARGADGVRVLRDGRFLTEHAWNEARDRIAAAVKRYGETHRLREGIAKGELKSLLAREIPASVFDEALALLLEQGAALARGDRVVLPDAGPVLSPGQAAALVTMERRLSESGWQVPEVGQLLKGIPASEKPQELVRYLVESGRVVKVTADLLYPSGQWAELESQVRQHFSRASTLTMATFKERFQVSRKYAIPILEYLDRTGVTRRDGDVRVPGPRMSKM
jgi:selenocysteine-specific elongation factor